MFNRLRQKWKVGWWQFILIFTTFALGGSLCGYIGRQALQWFAIENPWLRIPLYLIILTILWPACVLLVSLPLGQFSFFKTFLHRMALRLRGKSLEVKNQK